MKYILPFLVALLATATAIAQNLAPNPNFAIHDACPDSYSQLDKCKFWYNTTHGSPDYFNACHDSLLGSAGNAGVPDNIGGSQPSASKAYIGVYTQIDASPEYREYVRTDIPALTPGAHYRVLMRVSLGDNSYYATNAPGVLFYQTYTIDTLSIFAIPRTPQVSYSAAGNITDMINWVTVVDSFIADSAYTHLIIGNFNDDAGTTKTTVAATTGTHFGYYYIDSFSVEKIVPSTSITTTTSSSIKATLYPNPFTDHAVLAIENLSGTDNTLIITNLQGAIVKKINNIGTKQVTISRDGLEPGFYYYQLQAPDGSRQSGKMVIQ